MKSLTRALILAVAFCAPALAHTGATFLMPSVPEPWNMVIDGTEDDWGWYDVESFAVLPDQIQAWAGPLDGTGPGEQGEDFSATYFMAWSLPPDDALYFFARCTDDTLKANWGDNQRNWWDDDGMMIGVDSDHSGGSILVNDIIEEADNGYRVVANVLGSPEFGIDYGGMLGTDAAPGGDWGGLPPYALIGIELLPADADHGSVNVEYTYEWRLWLWDSYDPEGEDGDRNIRHTFVPDAVIHATPRLNDIDGLDTSTDSHGQYGYAGGRNDGQADGDQGADYVTILTHDPDDFEPPTAVENATWARIKSMQANKGLTK